MKRILPLLVLLVASTVLLAAPPRRPSGNTTITSDRLEFDYKDYIALFEGHVKIVDPQFTMKADKMLIHFENTNDVSRVDAVGSVSMVSDDKKATCGRASYTRATGAVVLTESPVVQKGENSLRGEKITIWIGDSRVVVENGVELQGAPENKKK